MGHLGHARRPALGDDRVPGVWPGLGAVGLGALGGFAYTVDVEAATSGKNEMYDERVKIGDILPDEHKRYHPPAAKASETAQRPRP